MPQLPQDGETNWGQTLNEFLRVAHNEDGTLKSPTTIINVKDYGAVGDGVTNDTTAFQRAAEAMNSAGGGKLIVPNGIYIVGRQSFAGTTGLGYSYQAESILKIMNCTKPVIIEGYGAVLKAAPDLKLGSFDPVTGDSYDPPEDPFVDQNYRADAYWGMIQIQDNALVKISNLELDGHLSSLVLGGGWGGGGRQCAAYGIFAYGNTNVLIENVYTHHHGLDGIVIGYQGLTSDDLARPHTLVNLISEYNARQGLSWVGGRGITAINCKFNHTGKSRFSSSPAAGLDIEAESSVCREGLFLNCEFINNVGLGVVSDSGDGGYSTFKNCTIWGTTNWSIWPRKPHMVFEDCYIFGSAVNVYGSADPLEATKFIRCHFEDKALPEAGVYNNTALVIFYGDNVLLDGCTFIANNIKGLYIDGTGSKEIIKNCTITHKWAPPTDHDFLSLIRGSILENVTFLEDLGETPNQYAIELQGVTALGNCSVSGPKAKAYNWSWGITGNIGQNLTQPTQFLALHKDNRSTPVLGFVRLGAASAAPTSGTWQSGDIIFNHNPTDGQPVGWICIIAGEPGTWRPFGQIEV